ncbi:MAG: PilZ domain-containing protein [Deltaproteobacteria bacterium]|nr:PilZ domain-containing protein [Deltaproteobacteria bacterium]
MRRNKRRRSRLAFNIEVTLGAGSKQVLTCMSKDVSMNGIFVLTEARIQVGAICGIEIVMTGKSSNLRIRARGIVARHASDGMGIAFQHDLEWWPMIENICMEELEAQN